MKNCNWSTEDPKAFVSSRLPKSPAMDYVRPEIRRVAASISADEEFFMPKCSASDGRAEVFANIPGDIELEHGAMTVVDCGFEMTLPAGYRISARGVSGGLFVSLADSKRVKISVFNGGEKCVLQDRSPIAKICIEPVYFF
jgi:hypothetical protein